MALGLAVAAVLAAWWLASTRLAILAGLGADLTSAQLLFAAGLLRAMLVAVAGPRAAAVGGYVAGLRVCLPIVAVAWALGGVRAALLVNPLLNVAAVLALYALASLLLGRRWALAAAAILVGLYWLATPWLAPTTGHVG